MGLFVIYILDKLLIEMVMQSTRVMPIIQHLLPDMDLPDAAVVDVKMNVVVHVGIVALPTVEDVPAQIVQQLLVQDVAHQTVVGDVKQIVIISVLTDAHLAIPDVLVDAQHVEAYAVHLVEVDVLILVVPQVKLQSLINWVILVMVTAQITVQPVVQKHVTIPIKACAKDAEIRVLDLLMLELMLAKAEIRARKRALIFSCAATYN